MTQQLKLGNGTIIPITRVQGRPSSYPNLGDRDYIEFYVDQNQVISLDNLDKLTQEAAGNTDTMTLITDDVDASGKPTHAEAPLSHYTYRVECGKTTTLISPETGTSPAQYQERVHIVLAQRTFSEVQQEQTRADIDYLSTMTGVALS